MELPPGRPASRHPGFGTAQALPRRDVGVTAARL